MYCRSCGEQMDDLVLMCPKCGTNTKENDTPSAHQQQLYHRQPQQPHYQQPQLHYYQQISQHSPYPQPNCNMPSAVNGLNIASMVLGIVSLLFAPCLWYLSIPMSTVGLVLGLIGSSKSKNVGQPKGMGTAGIVMSLIALVFAILVATIFATFFSSFLPSVDPPIWSITILY